MLLVVTCHDFCDAALLMVAAQGIVGFKNQRQPLPPAPPQDCPPMFLQIIREVHTPPPPPCYLD